MTVERPKGKTYVASKHSSFLTGTGQAMDTGEEDAVLELLDEGELMEDEIVPQPNPVIAPPAPVAQEAQDVAPGVEIAPYATDNHQPVDDLDDEIPAKWVSATTHRRIAAAIGASPNVTWGICGHVHVCSSRKRLLCHVRVHLVHSFCRCGYSSKWRESIHKHQADSRNVCDRDGPVYEVDRASFSSWRRILHLPAVAYPGEDLVECPALPAPQPIHPPVRAPSPRPAALASPSTGSSISHVDTAPTTLTLAVPTVKNKSKKNKSKKAKNNEQDNPDRRTVIPTKSPHTEEPRPAARDAREHLSRRAPASTTAKATPTPTTVTTTIKKAHPVDAFFTACTRDYRYVAVPPSSSSSATTRPIAAVRGNHRPQAEDRPRKRERSPEPRRHSRDRSLRLPQQPAVDDPLILDELICLVSQMEERFLQIVRLSRAQESDLHEMRRICKRHHRD